MEGTIPIHKNYEKLNSEWWPFQRKIKVLCIQSIAIATERHLSENLLPNIPYESHGLWLQYSK